MISTIIVAVAFALFVMATCVRFSLPMNASTKEYIEDTLVFSRWIQWLSLGVAIGAFLAKVSIAYGY